MSDLTKLTRLLSNESSRLAAAARIRVAEDFELPDLKYWNYDPCEAHEDQGIPVVGCQYRRCGLIPRKHQRIGSAWLYLQKRALLADTVGSGKTLHAAVTIAMMKESGELDRVGRVVIVVRSPAVFQWRDELERMLPHVAVRAVNGTKNQRIEQYVQHWEVLVIGEHTFLRDHELMDNFDLSAVFIDDIDALRNRKNKTAYALKRLARSTPRCVIMTGTPLQKKLHELHSVLEPLGGRQLLGSEWSFMKKYVRTENVRTYVRGGDSRIIPKIVGYKNLEDFREIIAPLTLRRTADDISDVDLPEIIPSTVYLDLYPVQKRKYAELKKGVLKIVKDGRTHIKHAEALAQIQYGAQICTGLAALGEEDAPLTSCKLDWVMDKIGTDGDLGDEKVVIFAGYINTVKALQKRLQAAGIGFVTIWGPENDKLLRKQRQDQFWEDPNCRVLIGTQSIEQSLNLQVARHLINIDTILNPARMTQLAGRIRRDGSAYKHVFVHTLLTNGTQEAGYMALLEREQALADFVWAEDSELFESLSPLALLNLIGGH
jgi:SNF2 family DNA or RNA helicase